MTDQPKCHMCDYDGTSDCRAENCIGDRKLKKEEQKKTYREVMKLMNSRSGDSIIRGRG